MLKNKKPIDRRYKNSKFLCAYLNVIMYSMLCGYMLARCAESPHQQNIPKFPLHTRNSWLFSVCAFSEFCRHRQEDEEEDDLPLQLRASAVLPGSVELHSSSLHLRRHQSVLRLSHHSDHPGQLCLSDVARRREQVADGSRVSARDVSDVMSSSYVLQSEYCGIYL